MQDLDIMIKGTNNHMLTSGKLHNAWRKGKPPPSLKVYIFEEDTKLCVVATLKDYLKEQKFGVGRTKVNFY